MNEKEFCYWLQGFFEMTDATSLTDEQVEMIKRHLALVFTNVTSDQSEYSPNITIPYPQWPNGTEVICGTTSGVSTRYC